MTEFPTTWSFSRWATYDLCPLKYKLQFVDKAPFVQSAAMARGDKIHKGIANFLMGTAMAMPVEIKTPFHQQLILELKDDHPTAMVEQKWGFTNRWTSSPWMGPAIWLRSILDVGVLYGDYTAEVIDWKTGKKYGDNAEQMELFALTTMAKFRDDAREVTTRLVYLDAGVEEVETFKTEDVGPLLKKWNDRAAKMLTDRDFFPRPNEKCKWCDFAKSKGGQCRYG